MLRLLFLLLSSTGEFLYAKTASLLINWDELWWVWLKSRFLIVAGPWTDDHLPKLMSTNFSSKIWLCRLSWKFCSNRSIRVVVVTVLLECFVLKFDDAVMIWLIGNLFCQFSWRDLLAHYSTECLLVELVVTIELNNFLLTLEEFYLA